jgi:hypothetical protein
MKGAKYEAQFLKVTVSYCPRPPVERLEETWRESCWSGQARSAAQLLEEEEEEEEERNRKVTFTLLMPVRLRAASRGTLIK